MNIQEEDAMVNSQELKVRPSNTAPTAARSGPVPVLLGAAHRVAIILSGVLAGAILSTWLSEGSLREDAELWISYHQAITAAYTQALPPIGGLALLATLATLVASWRSAGTRRLVVAALAFLVVGLLVTVVVHFPINDQIMSWQPAAPPADWQDVRAEWLTAHAVRTVSAMAGFVLLVLAFTQRNRAS
ncbi:MAG: DUF1772 domain-containing protein [Actinomycetota bacterium]|nr:DUF1772 domain-containing protein [Actinomycetota bacterium]